MNEDLIPNVPKILLPGGILFTLMCTTPSNPVALSPVKISPFKFYKSIPFESRYLTSSPDFIGPVKFISSESFKLRS